MGDEDEFYYDTSTIDSNPYTAPEESSFWDNFNWDTVSDLGEQAWDYVTDTNIVGGSGGSGLLDDLYGLITDDQGNIDTGRIAGTASGIASIAGLLGLIDTDSSDDRPTGYQGSIPKYTAVRAAVPESPQPASVEDYALLQQYQYDPNRRAGSSGRRYFSDIKYSAPDQAESARAQAERQAEGLAMLNRANPARRTVSAPEQTQAMARGGVAKLAGGGPTRQGGPSGPSGPSGLYGQQDLMFDRNKNRTQNQAKGYYLGGPTDGMADAVPAQIDNQQPAALSDGEFVIPADVVSHLGNGNSNAGAQQLYSMMDNIRQARTGTTQQGKQVNPNKFIPA